MFHFRNLEVKELTLLILMDYPKHIDTISIEISLQ